MATRLFDALVGRLGRGDRTDGDRRSVLKRLTMGATALAVAPADFVLRPNSAYAAVCRCNGQGCPCGSLCCENYTEFCCTLTGSNGCPPGTVAGGWWKVDGSGFCGGGPRYYLDCNAQCGGCGCKGGICNGSCSGTICGCAWGDCNNRKAGCVKFRYGQCNQHIACIGPIVCRMVTCTPPWIVDWSCTTASRTDNRTANHSRPCLEQPFGAIDLLSDGGGSIRVVGWAIDQNNLDAVEVEVYVDEQPVVVAGAGNYRDDVAAFFPYYGGNRGFDVSVPASAGDHVVCVWARDTGSQTSTFLAFQSLSVAPPSGSLDQPVVEGGRVRVIGWIATPVGAVADVVRLSVDGVVTATDTAVVPRPDVNAANPAIAVNCGFEFTVDLPAGSHELCIDQVYPIGQANRLGCQTVTVA